MNAKEYIESEYGTEHLKNVIELNDETSLFALMDEYAEWKNKNCNIHNVMPSASRPEHICDDEWWCPNCQDTVIDRDVTFDERHDKEGCYCPVI